MTAPLPLPTRHECRWDVVSLGEVMLRFDPGWGRVRTARSFDVYEGGGEYNVARAASAVFGHRSAVVTALPDNELGRLAERLIWAGGVDTDLIVWRPFDGAGRACRVGLNFTEKGFGIRPAIGVADRANSAASQLLAGEVDWRRIVVDDGARWLHTGGIFAALSPSTAEVVIEAVTAARAAGTIVSYDLNYRPSLWDAQGGPEAAIAVNRRIADHVDVMLGNEEDFTAGLGFDVPGLDEEISAVDPSKFRTMIAAVIEQFPNLRVVGTTLRNARTASTNDWGAIIWADGEFHEARWRPDLEIYDRVGGGDGFASGLVDALLSGMGFAEAVDWGCTHGALTMTTPGDTSMASRADVERAVGAVGARVVR